MKSASWRLYSALACSVRGIETVPIECEADGRTSMCAATADGFAAEEVYWDSTVGVVGYWTAFIV